MATKNCFIDKARPCDLTCKAAFPVDDAVDPVDCYFIWLAAHLGDGALDFRRLLEGGVGGMMPGGPVADGGGPGPGSGPPGSSPKGGPGGPSGPSGPGPSGSGPTGPGGFGDVSPN